jgi:hypothetical protein
MIEVKQIEEEPEPAGAVTNDQLKVWRSCCLVADKNMIVYLSQMIFALMILLFSCFQLTKYSDQCNIASPYYSLISFILGKLLSSIVTAK